MSGEVCDRCRQPVAVLEAAAQRWTHADADGKPGPFFAGQGKEKHIAVVNGRNYLRYRTPDQRRDA